LLTASLNYSHGVVTSFQCGHDWTYLVWLSSCVAQVIA